MKLTNRVAVFAGLGMGVLLLIGISQSQSANINYLQEEYGEAQEEMGQAIRESGWLEYNRGRVQETLGRFIQEGGPEGNVLQEELGSGIAAAAHIRWRTIGTQEAIAGSILRVANIVAQEALIVAGKVQEGFGEMILLDAQEAYAASQEVMGRDLVRRVQIDVAGGVMATMLQANLRGEETGPIPQEVIDTMRRNGAYKQLSNFALAVSMLEGETGVSLSHLIPNESLTPGTGTFASIDQGWGGFAEYGFFAIAGFVFLMWATAWVVLRDGPPSAEKEEEEFVEYRKAA